MIRMQSFKQRVTRLTSQFTKKLHQHPTPSARQDDTCQSKDPQQAKVPAKSINRDNALGEAFVRRLNAVIEAHIDDTSLNVDTMASEMCLGRTVFYKQVKTFTTMTPNDYLIAYRLTRAAHLLDTTHDTIAQVGYKVGFSTASHFTTSFKHFHGMTPSQYIIRMVSVLILCIVSTFTLKAQTASTVDDGEEGPIPVCYLLICCRSENKGTKFLINGVWEPYHDYRNIETTRYIMQKIKSAGINTVGVDFTNPSMWDVPVYDSNGHLVDDFSAEFKPMIANIVQVCQEKDMNFFMFLGDPNAWTMRYWNIIAKRVWEDYAQLPNYQHYGFGDDRPLLVMFLPGEDFWNNFNNTPEGDKDYIARFHLGTCQINGAINPQTSDGWGYRNYSQSSDGNVRFACPNGGVPPTEWYRIDGSMWKQRVDWAMKAHHYAVFGSYDDTCDGIFWGIADVSQSASRFHINSKTVDDPYLYYNILRDKLRGTQGTSILITQSDGNETAYTDAATDIVLDDALADAGNPIVSVRILQQVDDANVTYRRKMDGNWESLALPCAVEVTQEMLDHFIMAVPQAVRQTAYNRLQLTFRYLTKGERLEAFAPIIIKGDANAYTTTHIDHTTILTTDKALDNRVQVSCNGYTVSFSPNYELPILWPNSAYMLSNGTFTSANYQSPEQCYPYRLLLTIVDDEGETLYPGKTETYFRFNELEFIETPTSLAADIPMVGRHGQTLYNLHGQRMNDNGQLPRGIYLQDGRKIVRQ